MKVARVFLLGALAVSASAASVLATQCTDGCNLAYDACDAKMTASCKKEGALSPDYSCMAQNADACFWTRSDCIKKCDPWVPLPDESEPKGVSVPGPVTPPACQMACHKGEYAKIQACGADADCVAQVKATIADCMDACPPAPSSKVSSAAACVSCRSQWDACNADCWFQSCHNDCYTKFILQCTDSCPRLAVPTPAKEKSLVGDVDTSTPVGGATCVAACKLTAKVASAACKFQKPSHRIRCKQNVAKVETDCEAACVLIPTVAVDRPTPVKGAACEAMCTNDYTFCVQKSGNPDNCARQRKACFDVCRLTGDTVGRPGPQQACYDACHEGEYEKLLHCDQGTECIGEVESTIAECDAECDKKMTPGAVPVVESATHTALHVATCEENCNSMYEYCARNCAGTFQSCIYDCADKYKTQCKRDCEDDGAKVKVTETPSPVKTAPSTPVAGIPCRFCSADLTACESIAHSEVAHAACAEEYTSCKVHCF